MTAHWGIEDPAAVEGEGQRDAFLTALRYLQNRISLFLNLPIASLDKMSLTNRLEAIGKDETAKESVGCGGFWLVVKAYISRPIVEFPFD
ncbi:hypothetical protein [Qipengyuania flava]|uniref:hypothetical protein n=1 Tax=Qipengyuania flava TaxID=192812 RepID=UPI003516D933